MEFAHRTFIIQSISSNLCFYQVLSCVGISYFAINLFSDLCNPSAGFLFTLVDLSIYYLRLHFQQRSHLQV